MAVPGLRCLRASGVLREILPELPWQVTFSARVRLRRGWRVPAGGMDLSSSRHGWNPLDSGGSLRDSPRPAIPYTVPAALLRAWSGLLHPAQPASWGIHGLPVVSPRPSPPAILWLLLLRPARAFPGRNSRQTRRFHPVGPAGSALLLDLTGLIESL